MINNIITEIITPIFNTQLQIIPITYGQLVVAVFGMPIVIRGIVKIVGLIR